MTTHAKSTGVLLPGESMKLHEFVATNRSEIISRCRDRIAEREAPQPTSTELEHGVPLFLDQLITALLRQPNPDPDTMPSSDIGKSATLHGGELLFRGFTIAQVVHDYGSVCQAITELALEMSALISTQEFKTLNFCLDEAIAEAVTEYTRLRAHEGTERLGLLAHELRNYVNTLYLTIDLLKGGKVAFGGSTSAVLTRTLSNLRNLIDKELVDVRLSAKLYNVENIDVREFVADIEIVATMDANSRSLQFSTETSKENVFVTGDRQILTGVVSNLIQNAFKFTKPKSKVVLRAHHTETHVIFDVLDECGGIPSNTMTELFEPFKQQGVDKTGLGLGLTICQRGAAANGGEIRVVSHVGKGCVFTLSLPRKFI